MVSEKLYSFVIPTRDRHDVLGAAISTVLNQNRSNFELVVMDNCSSPETRQVVEAFASPKIRYVRAPERLAMSDNWEYALDHVTGDYVHYLGDDDGMYADSVEIAAFLHAAHPDLTLCWKTVHYFWPDYIVGSQRSFVHMTLGARVELRDCKATLSDVYACRRGYAEMPSVMFAFAPRTLIEQVRKKHGRYFLSRSPDLSSGVHNSLAAQSYLYSYRPLGINGASRHSNGASMNFREISDEAFSKWRGELKEDPLDIADPRLRGFFISEVGIADELFQLRAKYFPDASFGTVDMAGFLRWFAQAAPRLGASYDAFRTALEAMARRQGIDPESLAIPPRQAAPERMPFTFGTDHETQAVSYSYYVNPDKVRDVADFADEASRHAVGAEGLHIVDCRRAAGSGGNRLGRLVRRLFR